jgi:hypothetical protein
MTITITTTDFQEQVHTQAVLTEVESSKGAGGGSEYERITAGLGELRDFNSQLHPATSAEIVEVVTVDHGQVYGHIHTYMNAQ